MCLLNFMEFHHCLFKILKNQNVADGQRDVCSSAVRTDGRTNGCENSIPTPPQTQLAGGIKSNKLLCITYAG